MSLQALIFSFESHLASWTRRSSPASWTASAGARGTPSTKRSLRKASRPESSPSPPPHVVAKFMIIDDGWQSVGRRRRRFQLAVEADGDKREREIQKQRGTRIRD
ncbi:hypothetical protein Fmac_015196 [Flemingia macrophylla]|uniref:Uncharacterized protein n=1 Tax=Flemingia macrophylla TaxID=520843 RepID=A0ABD1MDW0_9FABA